MFRSNIIVFVCGLSLFVASLVIWIAFPLYKLPDGKVIRGILWSPPQLPIGNGYELLSDADRKRLSEDPRQAAILQNVKDMPRSYSATPIWLGNRDSPPRNSLILLPLCIGAAYLGVLRFRGIL